jgi:hypothetical protein
VDIVVSDLIRCDSETFLVFQSLGEATSQKACHLTVLGPMKVVPSYEVELPIINMIAVCVVIIPREQLVEVDGSGLYVAD